MGLWLIGFSLLIFLKHGMLKNMEWDKPVPVDVYERLLVHFRLLIYVLIPAVAVGYLTVGYSIWYYRRKRGAMKEHDETAA